MVIKQFTTENGMTIKVGGTARENDQLLKNASQKDLWFHLDSHASAHAILCCTDIKPSRDDINDAALLVKHFGKQKKARNIKVMYIEAKFVSKKGTTQPGEVNVTRTAKTINVYNDEDDIERLLKTQIKL
eukprot:gb/GECH01008950.1/.p1 GENE.gb/GECH01008950.1/~~gb/GECH01008950.1/.p1  ORF type:complete len:130 (+),score=32.67 gb/GECH01008950.1/:1-390(+)